MIEVLLLSILIALILIVGGIALARSHIKREVEK